MDPQHISEFFWKYYSVMVGIYHVCEKKQARDYFKNTTTLKFANKFHMHNIHYHLQNNSFASNVIEVYN